MQVWQQAVEDAPYRAPREDDEPPPEAEDDELDEEPEPVEWYAVSGTRVLLAAFFGGWLYQTYWMYRWWQCYRRSRGYARAPFWAAVQARTGYQVSPLWRALLGFWYVFCLFPAVAREARRAKLRGFGAPIVVAFLYGLGGSGLALAGQSGFLLERVIQALVLFSAQLTINRLNERCAQPRAFASPTAGEVICVLAGVVVSLLQLARFRP